MSQIEREYSYKPKWIVILLGIGFFALCSGILGYAAITNDRGLVLNGIIELSTANATKFYWGVSVASMLFVAVALLMAAMRLWLSHRIAFTADCLIVPQSRWTARELAIDYRTITGLSTAIVSGQRFLYIQHPGGKVTIVASMLPSPESFDEIRDLLAKRSA